MYSLNSIKDYVFTFYYSSICYHSHLQFYYLSYLSYLSYIVTKLTYITHILTYTLTYNSSFISQRMYHRLIFWKSIHLEVASDSFCLLINSPYLLVFALILISFIFTGFNLYCWTGIHFSQNNFLIFIHYKTPLQNFVQLCALSV